MPLHAELVEKVEYPFDHLVVGNGIATPTSVFRDVDYADCPQHGKMLGNIGLGRIEELADVIDALLAVFEGVENGQPHRVANNFE